MRVKKQQFTQFTCTNCKQSVRLAHPICGRCQQAMDAKGDKFFDYVSISKLRRSPKYDEGEDRRYYVCNLSLGGFLINGVTYNASKGSVMLPKCEMNRRITRPVKAFGATMTRVRALLDQAIAGMEGDDQELDGNDESIATEVAA
jgi:hypothetical protein